MRIIKSTLSLNGKTIFLKFGGYDYTSQIYQKSSQ